MVFMLALYAALSWIGKKISIDKTRYTHYARMFYIPAYWNENTNEITGRNRIYDFLIEYIAIPIQLSIQVISGLFDPYYAPEFMIDKGERIEPTPEAAEEQAYKDNTDY